MLPSFCRDTVAVLRAPLAASRGTRERDWARAESHEVAGCSVQPAETSTGRGEPRHAVSTSAVLLAPPCADIRAHDRIRCESGTYEVNGAPMAMRSPTGAVSHLRCALDLWEG